MSTTQFNPFPPQRQDSPQREEQPNADDLNSEKNTALKRATSGFPIRKITLGSQTHTQPNVAMAPSFLTHLELPTGIFSAHVLLEMQESCIPLLRRAHTEILVMARSALHSHPPKVQEELCLQEELPAS